MSDFTSGDSGDWSRSVPDTLQVERDDATLIVRLNRPRKRNALNDETVLGIQRIFQSPPEWARVAVLAANGEHFCAGLDLSELSERSTVEGIEHSQMWHRALAPIEGGRLPVVAVLRGAVIGGGSVRLPRLIGGQR